MYILMFVNFQNQHFQSEKELQIPLFNINYQLNEITNNEIWEWKVNQKDVEHEILAICGGIWGGFFFFFFFFPFTRLDNCKTFSNITVV